MKAVVCTDNPAHNRKIDGIYKVIRDNWVDGGLCENLPWPYIVSAAEGYRHFWLWDTAFNTAGWAPMGEERTRLTYRNHWHWIERNPNFPEGSPGYGMIPGVVVTDRSPDFFTFKYTQLPLTAWGVRMAFEQDGDRSFLEESLPYLRKYHRWYTSERDVDGDLLVEVGSYTGEVQHARFETLDFKPSLDGMRMSNRQGQSTGNRWYGDVELVEMTCLVIEMEKVLADFDELLGDGRAARRYRMLAARREEALNRWMWNEGDGFYYDTQRDTHVPIWVKTVMGFMPMFSASCSAGQAARLVEHLVDPGEFWTPFPVATSAQSEPTFDPTGFWRGDTWIMTNYLVAAGLCNYGYYDIARELTDRSFEMVDEGRCNERHHSLTGGDIGANFASFNSCLLLMIWQNYYGIGDDFRTIRVTDRDWGRHLRLGKLEIEYTERQEIKLRSNFAREFRVIPPDSWQGRKVQVSATPARKPMFHEVETRPIVFRAEPDVWYKIQRVLDCQKGG